MERRADGAALLRAVAFGGSPLPNLRQQKPSPEAVDDRAANHRPQGRRKHFNTLIPGVIEQGKCMFEQQNPNLGNALREVATKLRNESRAAPGELNNEVAKVYASRFTEKEIKDMLAFYQFAARPKIDR